MRCALVVSRDQYARSLIVEELIAARFFVEWTATAKEAQVKASRCAPDVLVVEHAQDDTLDGNFIAGIAGRDQAEFAPVVVTVDRLGGLRSERRRVTLVQRNDSAQDVGDAVRAIVDAFAARP